MKPETKRMALDDLREPATRLIDLLEGDLE
jgi:hypothetical protein